MYREYGAKHLKAPTVEVVPIQLLPLALHSIINIGLSSAIAVKHLLSRYILHRCDVAERNFPSFKLHIYQVIFP